MTYGLAMQHGQAMGIEQAQEGNRFVVERLFMRLGSLLGYASLIISSG